MKDESVFRTDPVTPAGLSECLSVHQLIGKNINMSNGHTFFTPNLVLKKSVIHFCWIPDI